MKILHWKMLEVLAQEVAEKRWAYVEQAPYPSVRTGNEYLYILLDIFATEDPRFWEMGLSRCPEKGTFKYEHRGAVYYGETAAKVFLEWKTGFVSFQALLYQDHGSQAAGAEWLKNTVHRMGGDGVDVEGQMTVVPYIPKEGLFGEIRE